MWRELETAMGPSRRRQGVRGLCACTPSSFVCKKSEMLRGRGLPPRTGRTLASLGGGDHAPERRASRWA